MPMGAGTPPRFGTDGVRGVAYTELTTQYVRLLGRAAARVLGSPVVLVGADPRESSPDFVRALSDGISAEGVNVIEVGVVPTPALAWMAAQRGVAAAMVTASHNPSTDNGIKFFAVGGTKLPDSVESRVEAELAALTADSEAARRGSTTAGTVVAEPSAIDGYRDHLVRMFSAAGLSGLCVVIDCANGAMSTVAPQVLQRLGVDVIVHHATPDGRNINDGCGATHPQALLEAVIAEGADAGLAFDGDGDRVIAATAQSLIDGDRLMAIVAPYLHDTGGLRGDTVVVTVMSNLGFRHAMQRRGIRIVETAVGDRYVLEALEREGLVLGGEQSGHVILRDRSTTGDGLLAGLLLLQVGRARGGDLAALAGAAMTSYPQVLVNVRTGRRDPDVARLVADEIASVEAQLGERGRVLVRPSGTEPLVRVMVEGPDPDTAAAHAHFLARIIGERLA